MRFRALSFAIRMSRVLGPYGGFATFLKGLLKKPWYVLLRRKYGFTTWHTNPIEWRPYSLEAVRHVNRLVRREDLATVVEVGCGLGEILVRIRAARRVGFDTSKPVLAAAGKLQHGLALHEGSFDDVRGMRIDVLLALGFTHRIDPGPLREQLRRLTANNTIRYILADRCNIEGTHCHDLDAVLGDRWRRIWRSGQFAMQRVLLCYERTQA